MKKLTSLQRTALLNNANVLKLTERHVVFTSKFKVKAAELSLSGYPPSTIFAEAGIDPNLFKPKYCADLLKKWRKKVTEEGQTSLLTENRGRKRLENFEDDLDGMDVDDLKAIIRIQQGMFEEIKKLKALAKKK